MNKRYLFLLAWVDGSDSADMENHVESGVEDCHDLMPQFLAGNRHIFAIMIHATSLEIAEAFGAAAAFNQNFTSNDTVSTVEELSDDIVFHTHTPYFKVITVQ